MWFTVSGQSHTTRPNASPWYLKKALTFSDIIECAKEDVLCEYISLHGVEVTAEFLLVPFPLNIVYGLLRKKKKAA